MKGERKEGGYLPPGRHICIYLYYENQDINVTGVTNDYCIALHRVARRFRLL